MKSRFIAATLSAMLFVTIPSFGLEPLPGVNTPPQGGLNPPPMQQPGPMNGQQPGPMNGQQPGPMNGQQPGPIPGQQPGPMNGQQPGFKPGQQPGPMNGQQPGLKPGQQPGPMNGQQPGHMNGQQPGPMNGQQPGPLLEGALDPNNRNFNPFDRNFKPNDNASVFKNIYQQFQGQDGKSFPPYTQQGNMPPNSVVNSVYRLENNVNELRQKDELQLPKFNPAQDQVMDTLEKIKAFFTDREAQFAKMMQIIQVIEQVQDEGSKKQLIAEFQNILFTQTEIDKSGHARIQGALMFINQNYASLDQANKDTVSAEVKIILEKLQEHKNIIKFLHDKLKKLKSEAMKDVLQVLLEKAEMLKKTGNTKDAASYYEKALQLDQSNQEIIKNAGAVFAEAEGKGPKVFVKGVRPEFDVKPTIVNGRTLVPLRAIANALGISNDNIKFDGNTSTITLIKGDNEVQLTIGKPVILINKIEKPIDVPAMIIDGRTLVPARVVSEALDAKVSYDAETQIITIDDNFTQGTQLTENKALNDLSKNVNADLSKKEVTEEEMIAEYLKSQKE